MAAGSRRTWPHTVVHFAAFIVIGIAAAIVMNALDRKPSLLIGFVALFLVFEALRHRRGRAALAVAAVRDDRVVSARRGKSAGGILHGAVFVAGASPGGGRAMGAGTRVTLGAMERL